MLKIDCERLILGYLLDNKYEESAEGVLRESSELKDCRNLRNKGKRLHLKLFGLNLPYILEDYINCKDLISDLVDKFPGTYSDIPKVAALVDQLEIICKIGLKTQKQKREFSKSFHKVKDSLQIPKSSSHSGFSIAVEPTPQEYIPHCLSSPTLSLSLHNDSLHNSDILRNESSTIVEVIDEAVDVDVSRSVPGLQLSEADHNIQVTKTYHEEQSKCGQTPSKRKGVVSRKNAFGESKKGSPGKEGERVQSFLKNLISNKEMTERIADYINQKWNKSDGQDASCSNSSEFVNQQISECTIEKHFSSTDITSNQFHNLSSELSKDPMFIELLGPEQTHLPMNVDDDRSLTTPQPSGSSHAFDLLSNDMSFCSNPLPFIGTSTMTESTSAQIDSDLNRLECDYLNVPGQQVFIAGSEISSNQVNDGIFSISIDDTSAQNNESITRELSSGRKRKRDSPSLKSVKRKHSMFDLTSDSISECNLTLNDENFRKDSVEESNCSKQSPMHESNQGILPFNNMLHKNVSLENHTDLPVERMLTPVVGNTVNYQNMYNEDKHNSVPLSDFRKFSEESINSESNCIDLTKNIHNISSENLFHYKKDAICSGGHAKITEIDKNEIILDNIDLTSDGNHSVENVQETSEVSAKIKNDDSLSDTVSLSSPSLLEGISTYRAKASECKADSCKDHTILETVVPFLHNGLPSIPDNVISNADIEEQVFINDINSLHSGVSCDPKSSCDNSETVSKTVDNVNSININKNQDLANSTLPSESPKSGRSNSFSRLICPSPYSPMKQLESKIKPVKSPSLPPSKYLSGTPDHPNNYTLCELVPLQDSSQFKECHLNEQVLDNSSETMEMIALNLQNEVVIKLAEPSDESIPKENDMKVIGDRIPEETKIPKKRGRQNKSEGTLQKPKSPKKKTEKEAKKTKAQVLRMLKAKQSPKKSNKIRNAANKEKRAETNNTTKPRSSRTGLSESAKEAKSLKVTEEMSDGILLALNSFRKKPVVPEYCFLNNDSELTVKESVVPPSSSPKLTVSCEAELENDRFATTDNPLKDKVYTFCQGDVEKIIEEMDKGCEQNPKLHNNSKIMDKDKYLNSISPYSTLKQVDHTLNSEHLNVSSQLSQFENVPTLTDSKSYQSRFKRKRSSSVHVSPKVSFVNYRVCKSTPRHRSHVRALDFGTPDKNKHSLTVNPIKAKLNLNFSSEIDNSNLKLRDKFVAYKPNLSNIHETSHEYKHLEKDSDIEKVCEDLYLSDDNTFVAPQEKSVSRPTLSSSYHVGNYTLTDEAINIQTPGKNLECDNLTLPIIQPMTHTDNDHPSDQLFPIYTDFEVVGIPSTPQGKPPSIRKYPSGPYSDSSEGTHYQEPENYSPLQANLEDVLVKVAQSTDSQFNVEVGLSTTSKQNGAETSSTGMTGVSNEFPEDLSQTEMGNLVCNEIISIFTDIESSKGKSVKKQTPKKRKYTKRQKNNVKTNSPKDVNIGKNTRQPKETKNENFNSPKEAKTQKRNKKQLIETEIARKTCTKEPQDVQIIEKAKTIKEHIDGIFRKKTAKENSRQKKSNQSPTSDLGDVKTTPSNVRTTSNVNTSLAVKKVPCKQSIKEQPHNNYRKRPISPLSTATSPKLCLEESSDSEGSKAEKYKIMEKQVAFCDKIYTSSKRKSTEISKGLPTVGRVLRSRSKVCAPKAVIPNMLFDSGSSDFESNDENGNSLMAFKPVPNTPAKDLHDICKSVVANGAMVAIPTPSKDNYIESDHSDCGEEIDICLSMSKYIDMFTMNLHT